WHFTFLDLHRDGDCLPGLPRLERPLPAGAFCPERSSGRVANGAPLLLLWTQAARDAAVQPPAETGLHVGDWSGDPVGANGDAALQSGAVLVAVVPDGRLSLGAGVAFCSHVRPGHVCLGTLGHGDPARVE